MQGAFLLQNASRGPPKAGFARGFARASYNTTVRFRTPVNTVVFHHQQVESVTLVDKKPAKWAFSRKA
jgi:hypothetical protein